MTLLFIPAQRAWDSLTQRPVMGELFSSYPGKRWLSLALPTLQLTSHTILFLPKKTSTSFWMKCVTTWVVTLKVTYEVYPPTFVSPKPFQLSLGNCHVSSLTHLHTWPPLTLMCWPLLLEGLWGPNYNTIGRSCLFSLYFPHPHETHTILFWSFLMARLECYYGSSKHPCSSRRVWNVCITI